MSIFVNGLCPQFDVCFCLILLPNGRQCLQKSDAQSNTAYGTANLLEYMVTEYKEDLNDLGYYVKG